MNRATKNWIIIASSLMFLGIVMFGCVMSIYEWDFVKLNTQKFANNTYELKDKFSDISINTDTADIIFLPSENEATRVVCYENKKSEHLVAVKSETLEINLEDNRKWYDYIGINFENPKITVYIPQGEYGGLFVKSSTSDVKIPENFKFSDINISGSTGDVYCMASSYNTVNIKLSTGDINLQDIKVGEAILSVSTGDINLKSVSCDRKLEANVSTGKTKLTDIVCGKVVSKGITGDISLYNVIAKESFSITRETGDVKFENSDAAEIFAETSIGNVKGNLLSSKVFITETSTGDIKVPKTVSGGKCEIITDTGDIKITIN